MEQRAGMDNKIKMIRLILPTLSLLTFCICCGGELTNRAEHDQKTDVAMTSTPADVVVKTQTPKRDSQPIVIKGGELCTDYLLQKIAKEKAEGSRMTKLKTFNTDDKTFPDGLKKWLKDADEEKLDASELLLNENKSLILHSTNTRATGLASNLQYWYIGLGEGQSITFVSFSKNPSLIFWDKSGSLNYYSIVYSDQFIEDKDWDNLTLDLERYRINAEGKSQLVSEEQNVKCE